MNEITETPIEYCVRHRREYAIREGCPFCNEEAFLRWDAVQKRNMAQMAEYCRNVRDLEWEEGMRQAQNRLREEEFQRGLRMRKVAGKLIFWCGVLILGMVVFDVAHRFFNR